MSRQAALKERDLLQVLWEEFVATVDEMTFLQRLVEDHGIEPAEFYSMLETNGTTWEKWQELREEVRRETRSKPRREVSSGLGRSR